MKKPSLFVKFLVVAALLAALTGCSLAVWEEPGSAPAQSSPGQSEPVPGMPADEPAGVQSEAGRLTENESPGLHLEELTVIVFDKAGPGDGGYRYAMTGTQQAELRALLQPDRWEAVTDLPEMGFGSNTRFLSSDLALGLIAGVWDGRTLILVISGEERAFFLAPPEVAGALDDFAAPFLQMLREEEAAALAQNTAPHSFTVAVLDAGGQTTGENKALTLSLPNWWEVRGNEIYEGDRRLAAVLGAYPASAAQDLWARYPDGSPAQDIAAGALSGRYYLLQEEVNKGGMTALENRLFYYLDISGYLFEIEFVPAFGIGIGSQREEFEGYLSGVEVE